MDRFLKFVGLAALVAVAVVVLIDFLPDEDGPPVTPAPTQATQPSPAGTPGTPPAAEAVRRLRLDGWSFDASSITLSYSNTGDTFSFGTAQCRVEFGVSGVMWPQMPLQGLDPGESLTQTHRDLWVSGNVPTLVPECVIIDP